MSAQKFSSRIVLFIKGLAMGAADVVPGVSGGTIAFITGIYEELVNTIDRLSFSFFKDLKQIGFKETWRKYNLNFLLVLGLGIATSIVVLAQLVHHLMEVYPISVWSFFFGLIVASCVYIGRQVKGWNIKYVIICLITAGLAYWLTVLPPMAGTDKTYFFFIAGFVGIIAMILPGISGAFILLLIGAYLPVIGTLNTFTSALTSMDTSILMSSGLKIVVFLIGMGLGLKIFSRLLTWLFKNFENITLVILTGFMIGSLNKIWPWKKVLSTRVNSKGEEVPLLEQTVMPAHFESEPHILSAVIFMIIGFLLIFIIERMAAIRSPKTIKQSNDE